MALVIKGRTTLAGATTVGWSPAALFSNGEQGAWYDPSDLGTMFQDTAGITPVTAVGQSVALMLDKSKGLTLGANIVLNGDFLDGTTYWTAGTGTTQSVVDGYLRVVAGSVFGSYQVVTTTAGKWYEVRGQIAMISGGTNVRIRAESGTTPGSTPIASSVAVTSTTPTDVVFVFLATASSHAIYLRVETAGSIGRFDNISVKEIPGNHATQATAGNRPVLQVENGRYYLEFDGATSNRWLQTGSVDFTATDKMTVVAGVRKNSDAAGGFLVELGTNYSNNGFALTVPQTAAPNYGFATDSVEAAFVRLATTYAAPTTNVLAGFFNQTAVSGPSSNLVTARIDGAVPTLSAPGGTYTGNGAFANAALYIGARSGPIAPLNGRIYSLLIRGATTSATDITRTERYVANRTGVTL